MKKSFIFLLFLALVAITPAKAFLVTIPDANFRARLQTLYPACFVSGQMETTCPGITSATSLVVNGLNIANLSGVQYFTSLQILWCHNNQLTSLPALPASLRTLLCDTNQLTSLPALPASLQFLACFSNQLTSLPTLPASLQNLDCAFNQLASLPALSAGLQNLNCVANQLTSLPALPASLQLLDCYINQLTSLPALPASLQRLACEINQLTSLPVLPASLQQLRCNNNLLDFADLEAINPKPATFYNATPQSYTILPATQTPVSGVTLTIGGTVGGTLNVYQWYKNNVLIPTATNATFSIAGVIATDAGTYRCQVTSTFVGAGTTTGVTITSSNVAVTVTASCPTITVNPTASALTYTVGTAIANINLSTTGGVAPYTYAISAGALPANVNIANDVISGNPTTAGNGTFTVRATDANSCTGTRVYTFTVNPVGTPVPPVVPPVVPPNPATSVDNGLANSVKVSPNPSNGDFNVDFRTINMAKSLVRVYDAQGKQVYSSDKNISNSGNLMTISLGNFANGIYLLEVQTENGRITKRLSKTN